MIVKELKDWIETLPDDASVNAVAYNRDVDLECRQLGVYISTLELEVIERGLKGGKNVRGSKDWGGYKKGGS